MEISQQTDIVIIGAGPAGITAAIGLGKKNVPCTLVDAGRFPRPKICGDGLSGKVLKALDRLDPSWKEELLRSGMAAGSRAVRFFSPAGKMTAIQFPLEESPFPAGLVCARKDFDHFLLKKALVFSSVNYCEGVRVKSIRKTGDGYSLIDQSGKWQMDARLVLVATGAETGLRRAAAMGNGSHDQDLVGVRAYFTGVNGLDPLNAIELHFLKELLPCYLWIFPYRDRLANIGIALPAGMARKKDISLKEIMFRMINDYPYLRERFAGASLKGRVEAHRLPHYTGMETIAGAHWMLLGDAARLVDPFTGEGISNAMISGMMAADVAAECHASGDFSHDMTRLYQEKVYKKLNGELSLGLRLHHLAKKPELLNLVIGRASKSPKINQLLKNMLFSLNSMGKLKKPLFYLKLALRL